MWEKNSVVCVQVTSAGTRPAGPPLALGRPDGKHAVSPYPERTRLPVLQNHVPRAARHGPVSMAQSPAHDVGTDWSPRLDSLVPELSREPGSEQTRLLRGPIRWSLIHTHTLTVPVTPVPCFTSAQVLPKLPDNSCVRAEGPVCYR